MSRMLSKMNLISVVQQLPKEDIKTIRGYVEMIEEENQELELELSGYRQAILNNKEMLGLKEKNQELKKQLEEYKKQVDKGLYNTCLPYQTGYNKAIKDKEAQQKEFIKWLESIKFVGIIPVEMVFDKYKEIIGVSNEKES